jgi:hypothetical protein
VKRNLPTLTASASEAAKLLWESIRDKQVVVWVDNFYRRRHGTDPQKDDLSLNVSVMTMMVTIDLRPYPGHPPLRDIVQSIPGLSTRVTGLVSDILKGVESVVAEPLQCSWIRVPLDIQLDSC